METTFLSVHKAAANGTDLQSNLERLEEIATDLPCIIIIHNLQTLAVEYMSPQGLELLGATLEEIKRLGPEYLYRYFNAEDAADYVPKVMQLMKQSTHEDQIITFFQQVRASENHNWSWYLSTSKVFLRSAEGVPEYLITIANRVDPLHHITSKVNRLLEENNFLRKNQSIFSALTKREKEVLRLMALGESTSGIALQLTISEQTAATHRKNIKNKLGAHTNYDITRFAQAFDLI